VARGIFSLENEVKAEFLGHQIRATVHQTRGLRLYIDGELIDSDYERFLWGCRVPLLLAYLTHDHIEHPIEVYSTDGGGFGYLRLYIDGTLYAESDEYYGRPTPPY
jgi:hypothetical protein